MEPHRPRGEGDTLEPAPSGTPSDDDRHGAAVCAPGRTGHVARALRAEKRDHGGNLLWFGETAKRPAGPDLLQHFMTRLTGARRLLVREAPVRKPCVGRGRARRDRVAPNPVLCVDIGDEARDGEIGRASWRG